MNPVPHRFVGLNKREFPEEYQTSVLDHYEPDFINISDGSKLVDIGRLSFLIGALLFVTIVYTNEQQFRPIWIQQECLRNHCKKLLFIHNVMEILQKD